MRILLLSDIHVEFWRRGVPSSFPTLPQESWYDVVVAAGDIGTGLDGFRWLKESFPNSRVLYVPGNHEYYHYDYEDLQHLFKSHSDDHVTVLNPGSVVIDNVQFIGATLWSSLQLEGYPSLSHDRVTSGIADFRVIGSFSSQRMVEINDKEHDFLSAELQHPRVGDDGKVVIVTHFVPSQKAIALKYKGDSFNPYFTQDMDHLMDLFQPDAWLYGHTHERQDIQHSYRSGTRLVGNPFGYPGENKEPYAWKIVDV